MSEGASEKIKSELTFFTINRNKVDIQKLCDLTSLSNTLEAG